jgi:hypothetical protein
MFVVGVISLETEEENLAEETPTSRLTTVGRCTFTD